MHPGCRAIVGEICSNGKVHRSIQQGHAVEGGVSSIERAHIWHRRWGIEWDDVGVRADRRSYQCSHIRRAPGTAIGRAEQGHMVVARLYRVKNLLSVGSGLAREWWQESMLREWATLWSACVRGDCGLSRSGSLSGRCVVYR